jgi:hypothetical protein
LDEKPDMKRETNIDIEKFILLPPPFPNYYQRQYYPAHRTAAAGKKGVYVQNISMSWPIEKSKTTIRSKYERKKTSFPHEKYAASA